MEPEEVVRQHYSGDDLEQRVFSALRSSGADPESLRLTDLSGIDHLHAGSLPATEHMLARLGLETDHRLLDVGCGIGGTARMAATRFGCKVKGVDLSPDFIGLARSLTDRLGLGELTEFDVASATELPYPDSSFDRAVMCHVGMNLPDKASVFAEVRRVLEPGGLFAVYDQMILAPGQLTFPLPWAEDPSSSFVETREGYAELLAAAGFEVEVDEDRTAAAAATPPAPDALNPGHLFGAGFQERIGNNIAAAMAGTLGAVLMVGRAA